MGGFSRLKRQPSLHGLSSRMSSFMSQDLDLPWTTSTKDNNNSLQYPTKSSSSTVLGKSNNSKSNNRTKSISKLPLFKSNKKISIITNRGVSPTITVISETSSSSSSSTSEEGEGFEIDVSILPLDDTVYNNLDNSDYINSNTSNNSSARSGELSSAHSGSLTTFANNCSPPILIPTNFDIEMDIVKSNNGGDGERIIESLSSLDKSSGKSRRSSSPKSVRSRLTVTPIVEFCTDNLDETVSDSAKEDLSPVNDKEMNNLESEVVMESTSSNNNKDMKEKMCHILVDELGSSIETLRSGGSVLSTNTSSSSSSSNSSGEQPKMFILPDELNNGDSSIETLRSGSASEKIFILPQEEGSRLSLDHQEEEKSSSSISSSGRSTPQEEQGLQLDIDKLQAYETIMKHLTAYEMSETEQTTASPSSIAATTSSVPVEVQKSKFQGEKKRSLLNRVGNHLDKKTYQGRLKRSRRRRSRRLRKKN